MGFETALDRAWDELDRLSEGPEFSLSFLTNSYAVRLADRTITGRMGQPPAPDHLSVLLLHYLIGILKRQFCPSGHWISFRDLWGGSSYYPAYHRSVLLPLIEKFEADPQGLSQAILGRLGGRSSPGRDLQADLITFPGVWVRVMLWAGEGPIPAEATMLFDRHLPHLLSTEDIVVMLEEVASQVLDQSTRMPP